MAETRRWAGLATRSQLAAANKLGLVYEGPVGKLKVRNKCLEECDSYYEMRQYAGLAPWDTSMDDANNYIPIRNRQPRIQYGFARVLTSRVASKLVGSRAFPQFKVEDDPDTESYLRAVIQTSRLKAFLIEPIRRMCGAGSVFVRFFIVEGQFKIQTYLAKWCYPEFDAAGNLQFIKIQYVYDDNEDLDKNGKAKKKWYKLELKKDQDILYDNPEYTENGGEPKFKVATAVKHDLGFVQGEWFKTSEKANSIDGESMIEPVMGFIDELDYSLSQTSTAIQYNQDPQLTISNMDEDDVNKLIRSASKAWMLGKDSEATFLEAGMEGVKAAGEFRDKIRLSIQDVTRVIMLDPEKMTAQAMSGRAMEIMHAPLIELIEELRPMLEKSLLALVLKMAICNLQISQSGAPSPVLIPDGYTPQSFNITLVWPEIFPPTLDDLKTKVSIGASVASASIFSRETIMKWLAKDFGVENIEEELQKVAAQPVINPFGGFGGG